LYILIFRFFIWDGKTKDFRLNNSKHSPNLIYSWFHHESHSDLLASSPSTWIVPHFWKNLLTIFIFWFCPEYIGFDTVFLRVIRNGKYCRRY
jgi:hypothetical protein